MKDGKNFPNIIRWYKFIQSKPEVGSAISSLPKDIVIKPCKFEETKMKSEHKPAKMTKGENQPKQTKDEGKFVDLPGMIL